MKTTQLQKPQYLRTLLWILLSAVFTSCTDNISTESIEEEILTQLPEPEVTVITKANIQELKISFNTVSSSQITHYKLFYATEASKNLVTQETVAATAPERFVQMSAKEGIMTISLDNDLLDFQGNNMLENTRYVAFVAGIDTNENILSLSKASASFGGVHCPRNVVTTLVSGIAGDDAVYVNRRGDIFVSEFGTFSNTTGMGLGTRIFKVTRRGAVSIQAEGYMAPMGSVIDRRGNFYFLHANEGISGELIKIARDGTTTSLGEIEGWPAGLVIDKKDRIYVSNFILPVVHRVATDGTISVFANDARLAGCVGIDLDKQGNLITANYLNADILKIDREAQVSLITTIPNTIPGFGIGYMTVLGDNIYATGIGTNYIYKVSMDGSSKIFAGTGNNTTQDGTLLEASFSLPNGIAADKRRRVLYISQYGEKAIRKIQL
ncbi:hypothetical protein [Ascidiimonas sp. W6]|uniref:hypothetical protein n=1 Tax=Ascidiimonas meishanensis TaxID=3128903 RepID=UPI0030ED628A